LARRREEEGRKEREERNSCPSCGLKTGKEPAEPKLRVLDAYPLEIFNVSVLIDAEGRKRQMPFGKKGVETKKK